MRPCSSCTCFIISFRFFIMSLGLAIVGWLGEAAQKIGIADIADFGAREFLEHGLDHGMFAGLEEFGIAQGPRLLAKGRLAQFGGDRHHPALTRPSLEDRKSVV